jgi:hypothetical protein
MRRLLCRRGSDEEELKTNSSAEDTNHHSLQCPCSRLTPQFSCIHNYHHCGVAVSEKCLSAATFVRLQGAWMYAVMRPD